MSENPNKKVLPVTDLPRSGKVQYEISRIEAMKHKDDEGFWEGGARKSKKSQKSRKSHKKQRKTRRNQRNKSRKH